MEKLEDLYEEIYLVLKILLFKISKKKLNEKLIKISFLNARLIFFLKRLIINVKKNFNFSRKNSLRKSNKFISYKYKELNYNYLLELFIWTKINFFYKTTNLFLKFLQKYKTMHPNNKMFWYFKKRMNKRIKIPQLYYNFPLKKALLKFILNYHKKKKLKYTFLNKIVFMVYNCEYKIFYNLFNIF
jgi:hypothetical protein